MVNPPIEMTNCRVCGESASYQNVEGNWCAAHWPQSKTMRSRLTPEQLSAKVIVRLRELGLDDADVMGAAMSIIPALLQVDRDSEPMMNLACELYARKMREQHD